MKQFRNLWILALCLLVAQEATAQTTTWYIGVPTDSNVVATRSNDTLTIEGTGAMKEFSFQDKAPWDSLRDSITCLIINTGVRNIGNCAFYECQALTSASIPNSVDSIGMYAFSLCTGLTHIDIPNSVRKIKSYAFSYCAGLTTINLAAPIERIETHTFFNCSSLLSVNIPSSVTRIGSHAFDGCTSLASVSLPLSLAIIDLAAFTHCESLLSINIPDSVTLVGQGAFNSCYSLTAINVAPDNLRYSSTDGVLLSKIADTLVCYPAGKTATSYDVPVAVKTIGVFGFYECRNLTSVNIPASTGTIEYGAFSGCDGLTYMNIPNSITKLGDNAFYVCTALTGVTLPRFITEIGENVFAGCRGLLSVEIPFGVTSIGLFAFSDCVSLTSVKLPRTLKLIDSWAFQNCRALPSIVIPDSVRTIRQRAFYHCVAMDTMYVNALTPPILGERVFDSVDKSIPVYVPCQTVGEYQDSAWGNFTNFLEHLTTFEIKLSTNDPAMGTVLVKYLISCGDSTTIIEAIPNPGYRFSGWSDGDTNNPRTIKLTSDTNLVGMFETEGNSIVETSSAIFGHVYPNPVRDNLMISLPDHAKNAFFILYDLQGRELLRQNVLHGNTISVDGFSTGLYIYRLSIDDKSRQGKLSIVK